MEASRGMAAEGQLSEADDLAACVVPVYFRKMEDLRSSRSTDALKLLRMMMLLPKTFILTMSDPVVCDIQTNVSISFSSAI